jgi:AraC-like DNA-binding protein
VPSRRESQAVQEFAAAAQVLAGQAAEADTGELCRALAAQIPEGLNPPAQRVVREILAQLACRLQTVAPQADAGRQLPHAVLAILRAETAGTLRTAFLDYLRVRSARARGGVDTRDRDPRVARAVEYISQRASLASLTLGDVASDVRLSKWHLARLLRRHTGLSFKAHVRDARLNAAGGLLMATGLSVKEIAMKAGYAHATDFNRQFKRVFASTPTAWRRQRMSLAAD